MKILLTARKDTFPSRNPIALLDLAQYLRSLRHSVDCYYISQLREGSVKGEHYDLVGLSVLQAIREEDPLKDAVWLKKIFNTKVVVGGKWTETITDDEKTNLQENGIDVCIGPGEIYFGSRAIDMDNYPSWNSIDFETLGETNQEVMSTRGCPYNCDFCHNTERRVSFFSAHRTVDNIELIFSRGQHMAFIVDDVFTLRPSHMEAIYKELKRRDIQIENRNRFFSHIRHINDKTLYWMKAYKPFTIYIGIESGDNRMLANLGKTFEGNEAFDKIKLLHENGLSVTALFMIGFPGENIESLGNTLAFIRRIKPLIAGIWVSYYQPVRGTKGYQKAVERGFKLRQGNLNTCITYVDPNLSKRILLAYRRLMYREVVRESVGNGLVDRCKDMFFRVSPYWLTSRIIP